jgi:murein DD-endopeptidase MepM/ murein hydrolase activator NlpD
LTQSRSHGAYRARHAEAIELGNEPPLSVDGGSHALVDRRRVSVQWFAGTILTALCGAALMGGAVFTSLDGQTTFASLPEQVEVALRGALGIGGDRLGESHKSDRLPALEEPSFTRQVIRISTISRVGNHEVVRVKPFVRVGGNLALAASSLTADIPPFNAQRLLAESAPGGKGTQVEAEPDAEVSFVMRDLATMMPHAKVRLTTPRDEVMARVREAAAWAAKLAHNVSMPNVTGIKLAYAGAGNDDPYAGFGARIVPENITLLPKTDNKTTGGNPFNEKVVVAKKNDSVGAILHKLGAGNAQVIAITKQLGAYGEYQALHEGDKLRVLMSPTPGSKEQQPVRVIVADDNGIEAVAALSDTGRYVAVDPSNVDNEVADARTDHQQPNEGAAGSISLYQSVYETALRNHVPRPIIDDLVRIYSFDVDFQRKVQPGDSFEMLYGGIKAKPAIDRRNDVLYASLTVDGDAKKVYRFQSPDNGVTDYYDPMGKSAKKFLVRKPVLKGHITSGFGLRRHPILGYVKMHTGVDWAAPTGTPIYAAGNGVIEKEGWESGYGRFMLLKHHNGYETAYGHMSAFAKGTHVGERVHQGQVIGFVGSTGLSTGSHLHFEIRINGRYVDPMRIRLPHGRELKGGVLTAFEQERARIDKIVARKPTRVASGE